MPDSIEKLTAVLDQFEGDYPARIIRGADMKESIRLRLERGELIEGDFFIAWRSNIRRDDLLLAMRGGDHQLTAQQLAVILPAIEYTDMLLTLKERFADSATKAKNENRRYGSTVKKADDIIDVCESIGYDKKFQDDLISFRNYLESTFENRHLTEQKITDTFLYLCTRTDGMLTPGGKPTAQAVKTVNFFLDRYFEKSKKYTTKANVGGFVKTGYSYESAMHHPLWHSPKY